MTSNPSDNSNRLNGEPSYWRSLAHLSQQIERLERAEDAADVATELDGVARRQFLKLMAASLGLAGVTMTGCRRWPQEQIVPHNAQPVGTAPGRREEYASCWELGGAATGVMITSVDGRPIKIEGNPLHPFSLGATDAWAQAGILELYDPERSRRVSEAVPAVDGHRDLAPRNWKQFLAFAQPHFDELRRQDGRGLAVLQGLTSSPTLQRQSREWQMAFPQSRWFSYEPIHRDNEIEGIRIALGQAYRPVWDFETADIVASFCADLLGTHPGRLRWARQWANRRTGKNGPLNRWYVAEPGPTLTGSIADTRLPAAPSRIPVLLEALALMLGIAGNDGDVSSMGLSPNESQWLKLLHTDLVAHQGKSVVVVGSEMPARSHGLAVAINQFLGNVGGPVAFVEESIANQGPCGKDIQELSAALESGEIKTLLILGGNPAYDAPSDARIKIPQGKALTSIHLSLFFNETSAECTWHVPMAHWLESWGDGRAWDGTYSVCQPLILPLFDGKTAPEMLAVVMRAATNDGRDLVRETCKQQRLLPAENDGQFEQAWEALLHDGVLDRSALPPAKVPVLATADFSRFVSTDDRATNAGPGQFQLIFRPDASVYDGRFANNGWLQEMPDPITKLTWDNAAWISPSDAQTLNLNNGDVIEIALNDDLGRCEIPAYIMPGQAVGTIGLSLGYGRQLAGEIGNRIGTDVYPLYTAAPSAFGLAARVIATRQHYSFAMTQDHHMIDAVGAWGRDERVGKLHESGSLVREATWEAFSQRREMFQGHSHGPAELQLFDPPSSFSNPHAWGMSIDLTKCIGCSACVIACQAENNIPIVGKDQVQRNREMHWIRIDRYFKGPAEQPEFVHMPMTCHHCETAPCEQVCPVAATVHDSEGLNTMVYNRCIGTRYCSNNCPAKVRHFNFFDYQATAPNEVRKPWLGIPDTQQNSEIDPLRRMQFNPEVTVRMRGVMEKCTFCTQRIQAAKISARVAHAQGRRDTPLVKDGEVIPACAAACPTQAILFGDLNDRNARVASAHADPRAYQFLEELQLRPRTRYLAKLRNPVSGSPDYPPHGEER